MKSLSIFKICTTGLALLLGLFFVGNLIAELTRSEPVALVAGRNARTLPANQVSAATWATTAAPFRSDLKAVYALALTDQALASDGSSQASQNETAQTAIRNALETGPHDSRLWLALALLQSQRKVGDMSVAETLKMSYFTGPAQAALMPLRLDIATLGNALNDTDLKEFARGDVLAIMTRYPDLRQDLIADYSRGSAAGKQFLEASSGIIDPGFVSALRAGK